MSGLSVCSQSARLPRLLLLQANEAVSSLAETVSEARVVAARLLAPPEPAATSPRRAEDLASPLADSHEDVAAAAAAAISAAAADGGAPRGAGADGGAAKPGDVDERYKSF